MPGFVKELALPTWESMADAFYEWQDMDFLERRAAGVLGSDKGSFP